MDLSQLLSSLLGGGIVLTLSGFVFSRIVDAIDKSIDRITALERSYESIMPKVDEIDGLSDHTFQANERLARLETQLKLKAH